MSSCDVVRRGQGAFYQHIVRSKILLTYQTDFGSQTRNICTFECFTLNNEVGAAQVKLTRIN